MKKENYEFVRYITNDNDARWADSDELKNASTITRINIKDNKYPGCGIPIISDGRIAYVDNSDTHTLIFGSTGSKKTRLFGMPLIKFYAMAGDSFIATDPKGELYQKTSGLVTAKGYKTIVLDFRDLTQSDFWNPLKLPYEVFHSGKLDEAISLLNDFILSISEPQRAQNKDIFFVEHGSSMVLAFLLCFIEASKPEEANILSFANYFATNASIENTKKISECIAEGSIADVNLKNVLTNAIADRTYANVASTVSAMINPFIIRKTLCQVLSQSSFDVRDIGKEKTAIYITVPDEKTTLHFLVTAFIKQTYEALINEAQQREDKKLPVRVNFLLDEFGNIPTIPDMASMISAARSRNMRFFLMVQGLFQMKSKYKEDADTIKGNCDNWIFLTTREYELLDEISKLCGESYYTDSYGTEKSRPLISISELQRLKKEKGQALILHGRNYPFVSELPDIDEYAFRSYKSIEVKKRILPKISYFDISPILDDIKNKKRPLLFSMEVFKEDRFYEPKKDTNNSDKNQIDW